ncbi:hypothetical protein GCM10029976_090690 [Kribbella albertanoniae]|uniref:Uncharacterized protein n=1 Tax=Kribbella albertanoniae TaxID=1266829 RepID=A0A4R4PJP4_9ACTN|nr:hypothetical protein [Kribbella albertanoniae]TDC22139.1 hypothetical protein E1261_31615 [Kribbella albertanoniae]
MRADRARIGLLVYVGPGKAVKIKAAAPDGKGRTKLHLQPDKGSALWVHLPSHAEVNTRERK